MSIVKPNNNTISAITALPAAIPTGKILQTVTGETTTNTQVTSTSYTDTSLTANITPVSYTHLTLPTKRIV